MDHSTFRALHKYGAVLSVVGTAVAAIAYAINGPDSVIGLFFGWAGPLGVFYFGGAYLSFTSSYRVVGEELRRGIVWYAGSLVGVAFLISETSVLSSSPVTVFGIPALMALGISLVMIATRYVTGSGLKVRSEAGQLLVLITGGVMFGFLALYLVLDDEAGWWLFGLSLLSIPVGLALRRVLKQRYPDAFGVK